MNFYEQENNKTVLKTREIIRELPEFCNEFFLFLNQNTLPKTRMGYAYDLRVFFNFLVTENKEFLGRDIKSLTLDDLQKIKVVDINQFMDYLAYYVSDEDSQLYSNGENGKARKLAAVRKLFKYFYRTEKISSNPAELTITPKRHEKEIVRLEPNEVAEMLDVIENGSKMTSKQKEYYEKTKIRDLAIVTLLLGTGLRVSECVGLDIDDVDFDVNGVRVLRKGSKEMIVYFGEEVEIALKDYLVQRKAIETAPEYEKALFLSMQKKRIGVRAVEKLVKKYASQVTTLKKISPHKLRSTYGTTLYRETGDIYLVADVLGHSDVNTTKKHYAQQSDDNRRRAARIVKLREE